MAMRNKHKEKRSQENPEGEGRQRVRSAADQKGRTGRLRGWSDSEEGGSDPTWVMESLPYGTEEMETLPPPIPPEEYSEGVDMKAMLDAEDKNLANLATVQDRLSASTPGKYICFL
eukprot:Skav235003  [mRNA]  locus=scaffold122:667206:675197:+ [translate_table: standard]